MRTTLKDLENTIEQINTIVKADIKPMRITDEGSYKWNIGTYHLSQCYGGYALHKTLTEGGGITDIFGGHGSQRELLVNMRAFIKGLNTR